MTSVAHHCDNESPAIGLVGRVALSVGFDEVENHCEIRAEQAAGLFAEEGPASPWHTTLLERFAAAGIPLGAALLPWGRVAACVGVVILSPFAVALVRLLLDVAHDLRAIRRKLMSK